MEPLHGEHYGGAKNATDVLESQFVAHSCETTEMLDADPLHWHKLNKERYSLLFSMAGCYLLVPATSVTAEWVGTREKIHSID
jgi:hypothetical protein